MSTLRALLPGAIPEWQERGLCRQVDPELFYPERGGDKGSLAKSICRGCEVRTECLEYALTIGDPWGVWGGKTEKERRDLLRRAAA